MLNIVCRNNTWYFNRRVPVSFKEFDSRRFVQISLRTKCKKEAIRLAGLENTRLMEYWAQLKATCQYHTHTAYTQAVTRSKLLGFDFIESQSLSGGNVNALVERLLFLFDQKLNQHHAEAVLGTVDKPEILLSTLLTKFWDFRKEVKLDKSDRQYKKWQNPLILAMKNFIDVVGDKDIRKLTRQDLLDFKEWWIDRIEVEKLSRGTANKSIGFVKNVIETVCENLQIQLDTTHIFKKLSFKHTPQPRLPFTTEFILNTILNDEKRSGMSDHFKKMIDIFAETGIHIDEQVGIRPENIKLDEDIPHVIVTSHEKDKLKTVHRERVIPLVGYALDAFKAYPKGFSHLVDNPDSASSAIGKYLREHNMIPSDRHSCYSLRHSFQDRLTNADCPDRIQTDLMGHAFKNRIKYGTGATLEHSHGWMKKIQLKPDAN